MKNFTKTLNSTNRLLAFLPLFACMTLAKADLKAQSDLTLECEIAAEFFQTNSGDADLGFVEAEQQFMVAGERSNYMAKQDTFKQFAVRGGELTVSIMDVFDYNEEFLLEKRQTFLYNTFTGEGIRPYREDFYTYNAGGQLVAVSTNDYAYLTGLWSPFTYREFEYDGNGNITKTSIFNWDEIAAEWKLERTLDREFENNLLVSESINFWDAVTEEFELDDYKTWEYEGDFLTEYHHFRRNTFADSIELDRSVYQEANEDLLPAIQTEYNRQNAGNEFRPFSQNKLEYNEELLVAIRTGYSPVFPAGDTLEWLPVTREEESYTDEGHLELSERFLWSYDSQTWIPDRRQHFEYDDYGNLTLRLTSAYNPNGPTDWELLQIMENEFDLNFPQGTYLTPSYLPNINGHMPLSSTFTDNSTASVIFKVEYIYSPLSVNTENIDEESEILLFPNPSKDVIHLIAPDEFNRQNVKVKDMAGRTHYSGSFNDGKEINVNSWPAGIYILTITVPEGRKPYSRQFIKQ